MFEFDWRDKEIFNWKLIWFDYVLNENILLLFSYFVIKYFIPFIHSLEACAQLTLELLLIYFMSYDVVDLVRI